MELLPTEKFLEHLFCTSRLAMTAHRNNPWYLIFMAIAVMQGSKWHMEICDLKPMPMVLSWFTLKPLMIFMEGANGTLKDGQQAFMMMSNLLRILLIY